METLRVQTHRHVGFINITSDVQGAVDRLGLTDGLVCVWVPHTTAGVIVNENADPDVCRDLCTLMEDLSERGLPLRHAEGNSPAHLLCAFTGPSVIVPVESGRLCLGTWQGIFFAEFDGPRERKVWIKAMKGA